MGRLDRNIFEKSEREYGAEDRNIIMRKGS